MKLAQCAVLEDKKALKQHRKRYPAAYERVIVKGTQFWRYTSDAPATLYGEFLQQALEHAFWGSFAAAEGALLVHVEKRSEQGEECWYMASFHPQLEQEHIGTLNDLMPYFRYALHHATHIQVTDETFLHALSAKEKAKTVVMAAPVYDRDERYELQRRRTSPMIWLGLGALGLGGALMLALTLWPTPMPEPTQAPVPRLTPRQVYEQDWQNKVVASDALLSARNVLIEAKFMPNEMVLGPLSLQNQSLKAQVSKSTVTRAMERVWLQANPNLAEHYHPSTGKLNVLFSSPPTWRPAPISGYREGVIDGLERLGGVVNLTEKNRIDNAVITNLKVNFTSLDIGLITVLAELLSAPHVAINRLEMTANEDQVALSFEVDLQGEINGR